MILLYVPHNVFINVTLIERFVTTMLVIVKIFNDKSLVFAALFLRVTGDMLSAS